MSHDIVQVRHVRAPRAHAHPAGDRTTARPAETREPDVRPRSEHALAVVSFAGATATAALMGGLITASAVSWYDGLRRPGFAPPDTVFGPVWSVLYSLLALAGYLVWRRAPRPGATVLWALSLTLNLLWTIAFFGAREPGPAIGVAVALWLSIVALAVVSTRHSRTAALLHVPYAVWVGLAVVMNVAIARSN